MGDMFQMYKIQNQKDQIYWCAEPTTWESRIKNRPQFNREIKPNMTQRENFFTNRISNSWNKILTIRSDKHGKQNKHLQKTGLA